MISKYYRFEDYLESSGVDEWDNSLGPPIQRVRIREFDVEKETPKGVWIRGFMFRRFQLKECRKRFACPSVELAMESFMARKRKQAKILRTRLAGVEHAMYQARVEYELKEKKSWVG